MSLNLGSGNDEHAIHNDTLIEIILNSLIKPMKFWQYSLGKGSLLPNYGWLRTFRLLRSLIHIAFFVERNLTKYLPKRLLQKKYKKKTRFMIPNIL